MTYIVVCFRYYLLTWHFKMEVQQMVEPQHHEHQSHHHQQQDHVQVGQQQQQQQQPPQQTMEIIEVAPDASAVIELKQESKEVTVPQEESQPLSQPAAETVQVTPDQVPVAGQEMNRAVKQEQEAENPAAILVNPWLVSCLEDFLYYCCPECDNKCHSRQMFITHAWQNHSQAKEVLPWLEADEDSAKDTNEQYGGDDNADEDYYHPPAAKKRKKRKAKPKLEEDMIKYEVKSDISDGDHEFDPFEEDYMGDVKEKENQTRIRKTTMKCDKCDFETKGPKAMTKHKRTVHNDKTPHKCTDCNKAFAMPAKLKDHMEKVHIYPSPEKIKMDMPVKCDKCGQDFDNMKCLKMHMSRNSHCAYKDLQTKTTCEICGHSSTSEKQLAAHKYMAHPSKKRLEEAATIKCDKCDITFEDVQASDMHYRYNCNQICPGRGAL